MRVLLIQLLLILGASVFFSTNALSKGASYGMLIDQGYVTSENNPQQYTAAGLFYLSRDKVKITAKFIDMQNRYSDMNSLSFTKLTSLNRKGLYHLAGAEVLSFERKKYSHPGVSRLNPIFGFGVFLTRRDFLSQVELSVHYPRVELTLGVGY